MTLHLFEKMQLLFQLRYLFELLQMKKDKPCLLITRKTWVRKVLVTYGKFYHPGDRYELLGNYGPIMRKKLSNK